MLYMTIALNPEGPIASIAYLYQESPIIFEIWYRLKAFPLLLKKPGVYFFDR